MTMATQAEQVSLACETAVNAVLLARVYAETKRAQVDAVKREVLAAGQYMVAPDQRRDDAPERIADPMFDWLMTTVDFAAYCITCDKIERERGIKPADMPVEHCPALVAEDVQRKAQHVLLECAGEAMGQPKFAELVTRSLDGYEKAIDLLCRMVVNRPGYKNPLTGKAV